MIMILSHRERRHTGFCWDVELAIFWLNMSTETCRETEYILFLAIVINSYASE